MKKKLNSISIGCIYAYIHYSVEVACFYFLFSRINDSSIWWVLALLFDALAFVTQGFIGIVADKYKKFNYDLLGCIVISLSLLLPFDILSLIMICIGNALVHIGGAQLTLKTSGGKITPTSIFVGGGSFGVITGQLLGMLNEKALLIIPLVLMVISIFIIIITKNRYFIKNRKWNMDITSNHSATLIMLIAFLVVAIRAYIGYAIPTEWNKTQIQAILLFAIMGIGKISGGILADTIGYYKTILISSFLSLPFLLFGNSIMILSLVGVGLFSMTMPITIAVLVSKFPQRQCFAFGITTVALFVGTFPAFFIRPTTLLSHQITVFLLIFIATVALLFCIEKRTKNEYEL